MALVLIAAAVYNSVWGVFLILRPLAIFDWAGMPAINYPEIVQCGGAFVAICGLGYALAAINPLRHWPIVLVGLTMKLAATVGFGWALWRERLPQELAWVVLANDLIWCAPFAFILFKSYDAAVGRKRVVSPEVRSMALRSRTQSGITLDDLSRRSPIMLVFLRHLGCTFCRESLADLAKQRRRIEAAGTRLVLIHMASEERALPPLSKHGLCDIARVSDPTQTVYRAFGLGRGRLLELFGPKVLLRGLQAGLLGRHGAGALSGDGFQMPGVFVVYHGQVIRSFVHQSAADRPDYLNLACDQSSHTGTLA